MVLARSDLNLGVEQSRGTNNLFHDHTLRLAKFEVGRSGRHINHLVGHLLKLVKRQRAVVECSRQSESILHEIALACPVASVHRTYLRHAHMALVDDHKIVLGEEVEQTIWSFSRFPAVEVSRVVLDTRAMSEFLNHLHVIFHAFLNSVRLDVVALFLEELNLLHKVVLYVADGNVGLFLCGGE